jgi:DNA-damage-inducible protein J
LCYEKLADGGLPTSESDNKHSNTKEKQAMVTVSLRFDDETKRDLDQMCGEMGMNLTTFFMIYARAALRERRIPFEVRAEHDAFYSKENLAALKRSADEARNGKVIEKSLADLEAMEK